MKWVEEKPLANIKAPTKQKFFWENVICRFGVPRELTVDKGNNLSVTISKNTARLWALVRNFHQFIIRSLTQQSKGQMG
jgi:hypothetical protein